MLMNLLPGLQHLQNIHPVTIHFPIAFLTGAALCYVTASILRHRALESTAFWLLLAGAVSAAIAAGTGLYAEDGVMVSYSVRAHLLQQHERLMLATLGLSVFLSAWASIARPFPRKGRALFVLLCGILLVIMSIGADYGARLVYDYNAGGDACSQPIEFTR
jgi:uncharacterized membrane protein